MNRYHSVTRIEAPREENKLESDQTANRTKPEQEEEDQEEKARCEWDFSLGTVVSSASSCDGLAISDALGVIEFDESEAIVATGGIARKIRIYGVKSLLPQHCENDNGALLLDHSHVCNYFICTPAKLSSLRWKPGSDSGVIASGDYDGVVMEYDLETRTAVFERDEHGGRRVWSVDYSHHRPVVGASGSDDGTIQIWDPRCEGGGRVATVKPSETGRAVCGVEFNPFGGPIVAVGCADKRVYGYDMRSMNNPLMVFNGHNKTVTYVRFVDNSTLVSAAIDGCLKLWNLRDSQLVRTYKGHLNSRNFVGLSVWRNGGLLGCGSENNRVFVYDKRWSEPIWVHGSEPGAHYWFINSVCWSQIGDDKCTLVTGGSNGVLQVYRGRRKPRII